MRYAVIAAGEGSRLASEGITSPKPLVQVGGERLIDRLLRIFVGCGATDVVVICNEQMTAVRQHLAALSQSSQVPLRYLVKSTPSSMHSLWELSPWLADEPFVLTTVDTVFREEEFKAYISAFRRLVEQGRGDGLMGVTDYIDDEKPLYVGLEGSYPQITGFYDNPPAPYSMPHASCPMPLLYVSAGIYGLTQKSLVVLRDCVERGEQRMRNFQRALLRDGLRLQAYTFTQVFDIDHATDIEKANSLIES